MVHPAIQWVDSKVALLDDPVGKIRWRNRIALLFGPAALMTLILWMDQNKIFNFNSRFGLQPQHFSGLIGLIGAPFLHGNWDHLKGNLICWFVLGPSVMTYTMRLFVYLFWFISIAEGMFTWCVGQPNSLHVGLSGVLFGFMGFLLTAVFWRRPVQFEKVANVIVTGFCFGAIMLSAFDIRKTQPGVSWEGHMFGASAGMFFAFLWYYKGLPWNKEGSVYTTHTHTTYTHTDVLPRYQNVNVKDGNTRLISPKPASPAPPTYTSKAAQPSVQQGRKSYAASGGGDIYRAK